MRLAYTAGPYRAASTWGVTRNIEAAREVAETLWRMGFAVLCPHANTALMDGPDVGDDALLEGTMEMMERCDLVVMLPGWSRSDGSIAEMERAIGLRIPVYHWPDDREALDTIAAEPPAHDRATRHITVAEAASVLGKHAAAQRKQKISDKPVCQGQKLLVLSTQCVEL